MNVKKRSEIVIQIDEHRCRPSVRDAIQVARATLPIAVVLAWLIGSIPGIAAAEYIIQMPNGRINWSAGKIIASGAGSPTGGKTSQAADAEAAAYSAAMQAAGQNLFDILQQVRIDSRAITENLAALDPQLLVKAREMVFVSPEIESLRRLDGDGTVTVFLQFQLHGGFAQLVLPREITHVDSITQVIPGKNAPAAAADPDAYTGLVVDARHIGTQAAMVPRILDENMQEVYGPAFASREYAVQKGMSGYEIDFQAAAGSARVGDAPLIVKGLRTEGPGQCDIVITNADAARIRQSSEHLLFLRQCRVIIVLDAPQ